MVSEEKRSTDLSDNDEDSGNDEPPYKEGRDLNVAFAMPRNGPDDGGGNEDPDDDNADILADVVPPIDANERAAQIPIAPLPRNLNDRIAIYENAFLGNRPDPQPPRNLRQYLNALTENHELTQNAARQAINNDFNNIAAAAAATTKPGNTISALPVEVLLVIFSYLDDISLCHVGEVCKQWKNILEIHTPQALWQRYTRTRWPLYHQITNTTNWFKVCRDSFISANHFQTFIHRRKSI